MIYVSKYFIALKKHKNRGKWGAFEHETSINTKIFVEKLDKIKNCGF